MCDTIVSQQARHARQIYDGYQLHQVDSWQNMCGRPDNLWWGIRIRIEVQTKALSGPVSVKTMAVLHISRSIGPDAAYMRAMEIPVWPISN